MGCCSSKDKKHYPDDDDLSLCGDEKVKADQPLAAGDSNAQVGVVATSKSSRTVAEALKRERKLDEENTKENNKKAPPQDELTWVRTISPPPPPEKFPYYVTAPVEEMHLKLFQDVFQLLLDEGIFYTSKKGRARPPFEFKSPEELRKAMDLSLPKEPVSHYKILELIRSIIRYEPHVSHPFFMEMRIAGLDPFAMISDMLATVSNSNNVLYILSTATTLLELELIRAVCHLVGYDPDGDGDGTVTPGSVLANGYAMRMAVKQKFHNIKHTGLFGCRRPIIFVSENSAHIHKKCAIFQGFGYDSVVSVKEDERGRMSLEDLKLKIDDALVLGFVPCMVVATAGSIVLRAIDPLEKIADLCKEKNMWFHCDASFGGALLCSNKLKEKLRGIERSDSVTWSQHFVLGVPVTSTVLAIPPRHQGKLTQYLGLGDGATYGFIRTPLYDSRYDISHNTILSCRRPDMLKFWFMWKAKGTKLMGKHVEHIFRNARFCLEEVMKRPGFEPIIEELEGTNVCFYYVPKMYRELVKESPEFKNKISLLTVNIRRILVQKGVASISYHELRHSNNPTFLVMGLHNSAVTRRDIVYLLDRIQHFGDALANASHSRHKHYHELITRRN